MAHSLAVVFAVGLVAACGDEAPISPATGRAAETDPILLPSPDGEAILRVERDPLRIVVETLDGREVVRGRPGGFVIARGAERLGLGPVFEKEAREQTLRVSVASAVGPATLAFQWRNGRNLEIAIVPPSGQSVVRACQSFELAADEAIYGLSERPHDALSLPRYGVPWNELLPRDQGSLSRRGERVEMFVRPTVSLYAPFYVSSHGYGHLVEGTWPGRYDVGARDESILELCFDTSPDGLRTTLFLGDPAEVLDAYTAHTGRPFVPPDWAFAHWRWRDELAIGEPVDLDGVRLNAQLAEDLIAYERHGIPSGVYLIDRPWSEGVFGFEAFRWDRARFPDPEGMRAVLDRRGWRLALWSAAFAVGENLENAREREFLAPGSDLVLDLTNEAARDWWRAEHVAFAKAWDVSAIKLDRGEEQLPSRREDVWSDGRTGREVHNAYPVLQAQLYHEILDAARGKGDFLVLARAGYTGAQAWTAAWGGDIPGKTLGGRGWGTDLGLRMAIVALLRAGFLGYPFWGSDTGGYYEFSDREVFARWLELSCFNAIMEIGGHGAHAPWAMPPDGREDPEMIEIYRRYVQLHHDLVPYIVAFANGSARRGLPVARALVFDHPDDPRVRDLWDQFLFGTDLLVAPVWRSGARSREVYLPAGRWEDFWNPERRHEGPVTLTVAAPLDRIPVFVREGARIPGRDRARGAAASQ